MLAGELQQFFLLEVSELSDIHHVDLAVIL